MARASAGGNIHIYNGETSSLSEKIRDEIISDTDTGIDSSINIDNTKIKVHYSISSIEYAEHIHIGDEKYKLSIDYIVNLTKNKSENEPVIRESDYYFVRSNFDDKKITTKFLDILMEKMMEDDEDDEHTIEHMTISTYGKNIMREICEHKSILFQDEPTKERQTIEFIRENGFRSILEVQTYIKVNKILRKTLNEEIHKTSLPDVIAKIIGQYSHPIDTD